MTGPGVIDNPSDPAVTRILDLMKPSRGAIRTALIEDVEPIVSSIAAGVEFVEVYSIATTTVPAALREACEGQDVPLRLMDAPVVNQIFRGEKRPKIFGVARVPRPHRMSDLARTDVGGGPDIVLLDGVKIVGNIGAIVRTAFALGAGGIILVDSDLAAVADRRLVRASRAYVFSLPVVLSGREQALSFLREQGVPLVRFEASGGLRLPELRTIEGRLALLFGSEKYGPSTDLGDVAEHTVSIRMNPAAESLNVSVSVGIALAERVEHNLPAG